MTPAPSAAAQARTRRRRIAFAATATLAATVWAGFQDDVAPEATTPAGVRHRSAASGAAPAGASAPVPDWPELPTLEARQPWRGVQPQGVAAWGPPPPPPAAPAPPPAAPEPPQPPAFPYTLIGRIDDGQSTALLTDRTRSFGAKARDVIDGVWRVDAVDADGMTLTWLPGGITTTLPFPS